MGGGGWERSLVQGRWHLLQIVPCTHQKEKLDSPLTSARIPHPHLNPGPFVYYTSASYDKKCASRHWRRAGKKGDGSGNKVFEPHVSASRVSNGQRQLPWW